ncbi:hypothetical protein NL523_27960, partial [Klebsiella pneumoniae]|nr:hypothetical protein [Klebsiella pneumoniae]MCP6663585.1 hypothetical protein [Klebsiella pneumoniae]
KSKVLEYTIKLAEKYCCPQYELFPDLSKTYSGFVFENKLQIMGYLDKIKDLLAALAAGQMPWERLNRALEVIVRYIVCWPY